MLNMKLRLAGLMTIGTATCLLTGQAAHRSSVVSASYEGTLAARAVERSKLLLTTIIDEIVIQSRSSPQGFAALQANALGTSTSDSVDRARREKLEAILEANSSGILARRWVIDWQNHRARCEERDLRDLDGIAAQLGLNSIERLSLDQSRTRIYFADRSVTLLAHGGGRAIVAGFPRYESAQLLPYLGMLPPAAVDANSEFHRSNDAHSGEVIEIAGCEGQGLPHHLVWRVRPDLDCALTSFTLYGADGMVRQEFQGQDWRQESYLFVPGQTTWRIGMSPGGDSFLEERFLVDVKFDTVADAELFSIPEGYRVLDLTSTPPSSSGAPESREK